MANSNIFTVNFFFLLMVKNLQFLRLTAKYFGWLTANGKLG